MMDYSQLIGNLGGLGTTIWGLADASSIFGSKPKVAQYRNIPIGPGAATSADISGFPGISQLGNLYQSYLTDQYRQAGLDVTGLTSAGSRAAATQLADAQSMLQGEIPQDVRDQILRSDAYQSFAGGYGGSQMAHGLTARDLGLTSLDLMGKGALMAGQAGNAAQRWAQLAGSTMYDPSQMFTTPQQAFQEQYMNQMGRLATQQARFNVAAAPNPASAGSYGLLQNYFGSLAGGGGAPSSGGSGFTDLLGSFI